MAGKKGGIIVKVARAGARVQEVALNGGRSIKRALEIAELTLKPSEVVYVNDKEISLSKLESTDLENGDEVILVKDVQGGANKRYVHIIGPFYIKL